MHRYISIIPLVTLITLSASCARGAPGDDLARIRAAQDELMEVRDALTRYFGEHESEYPETATISSHSDLVQVLAPYEELPDASRAAWTFVSYRRAYPDTFVLYAKAGDTRETNFVITSEVTWTDTDILETAILELDQIIMAFLAYQADSEENAFPGASDITSQEDVVRIVLPYKQISSVEDAKWRWVSYARLNSNWFVLRVEVKDQRKSNLWVTSEGISSERPSLPPPP
ncbi:hypothetical protein ACFL3X_00905 [Gemmatimonadota bacterium]